VVGGPVVGGPVVAAPWGRPGAARRSYRLGRLPVTLPGGVLPISAGPGSGDPVATVTTTER
jgi:hypothetical protein